MLWMDKGKGSVVFLVFALLGGSNIYAKNISLPPNASKEVVKAAEQLENSIRNTLWQFECEGNKSKFQFGFDSTGKIVMNDTYQGYEWKVDGPADVKFIEPNGHSVSFKFLQDRRSLKFISFEGWNCSGIQK